jgi:hypothetical protein
MQTLNTKRQVRDAILDASAIEINGEQGTRTKSNAGFLFGDEFEFVDDLYKRIIKQNLKAKMNETVLYVES